MTHAEQLWAMTVALLAMEHRAEDAETRLRLLLCGKLKLDPALVATSRREVRERQQACLGRPKPKPKPSF